jgi:hypothetical protein
MVAPIEPDVSIHTVVQRKRSRSVSSLVPAVAFVVATVATGWHWLLWLAWLAAGAAALPAVRDRRRRRRVTCTREWLRIDEEMYAEIASVRAEGHRTVLALRGGDVVRFATALDRTRALTQRIERTRRAWESQADVPSALETGGEGAFRRADHPEAPLWDVAESPRSTLADRVAAVAALRHRARDDEMPRLRGLDARFASPARELVRAIADGRDDEVDRVGEQLAPPDAEKVLR